MLAQHYNQSKQMGSDSMRKLHQHTAVLVNGLKALGQRQTEAEAFISLQKRYVTRLPSFHSADFPQDLIYGQMSIGVSTLKPISIM